MDHKVWMYLVYLAVSVGLTVWVATTLSRNGLVFLEDVFDDKRLAKAVNQLLVMGFYLLNLGYVTVAMRSERDDRARQPRPGEAVPQDRPGAAGPRRPALLQRLLPQPLPPRAAAPAADPAAAAAGRPAADAPAAARRPRRRLAEPPGGAGRGRGPRLRRRRRDRARRSGRARGRPDRLLHRPLRRGLPDLPGRPPLAGGPRPSSYPWSSCRPGRPRPGSASPAWTTRRRCGPHGDRRHRRGVRAATAPGWPACGRWPTTGAWPSGSDHRGCCRRPAGSSPRPPRSASRSAPSSAVPPIGGADYGDVCDDGCR